MRESEDTPELVEQGDPAGEAPVEAQESAERPASPGVAAAPVELPHLNPRDRDQAVAQFGLLMDVGVEVKAVVGSRELPLQTVLAIHPGTILELERMAGEPIELQVNGKPIARAEVVVIEGRLGARILEMLPAGSP